MIGRHFFRIQAEVGDHPRTDRNGNIARADHRAIDIPVIAEKDQRILIVHPEILGSAQFMPVHLADDKFHDRGAEGLTVGFHRHAFKLLFQCRIASALIADMQQPVQLFHGPLG